MIISSGGSRSPGRPRSRRLKAYFGLLAVLFVATAAGAVVYVSIQSSRDGRADAEHDARFAARTAAGQLGNGIAVLRATVAQLAANPRVSDAFTRPEECTLAFAGPDGVETGHIDIVRSDGAVACSSRPRKGGAPLAGYRGEAWLARARTRPLLAAPIVDRAAGGNAVLSAAPIRGGVVAAFLALEPAGPGLARLFGGGRPAEFIVTSRDGRVLARSIDPGRWVGASLADTGFRAPSDRVQRNDLDGTSRLYADARVPGVGWTFSVGEEAHSALADANRLRDRQLLIIILGLALVLAAAFYVLRRVVVPVTRLGRAVRETSRLSPPAPVPVSGPAEVSDLGDEVNGLIAAVNRELVARERAEQNYRLLFERSPVPMWIHDAETGAVLEVNDAAVSQYGYSREEFLALTTEAIAVESSLHRRKDGSRIEVRAMGHDVTFGERAARFVLAEDVGERERLEGQLRQAQRMEAIGRLAGGVAHDFNNLLTAVIGYSELLLERTPPDSPHRAETEEIKKAGERAVALTRQLLTFGRGGGQELEPVVLDLNETVRTLEPMLRRLIRSDIAIETRLSPGAGSIRADRGQIEQVLVNLAVNAGDAMPDGGSLTITTAESELDEEYFQLHPATARPAGRYAMLEVADTGVGMDEATLSQIFEPFFTTKGDERGTGLGLATVYGIVRQSGGFVWAYSEPGRGSSFKVYLPLVEAPVEAEPQRAPNVRLEAGGLAVLLVEDDATVRAIVRRMLDGHGFDVLEASDGDEALSLSDARDTGTLDVLVTDTVIPGPGGAELADRIRRRHPSVRTVIMSGYSEPLSGGERELGPGTEFIAKPFSAADLSAKLRVLLGEPVG